MEDVKMLWVHTGVNVPKVLWVKLVKEVSSI